MGAVFTRSQMEGNSEYLKELGVKHRTYPIKTLRMAFSAMEGCAVGFWAAAWWKCEGLLPKV